METFSEVTKIKIKILEEGINFEPISLFSDIIKEIHFKNKTIYKSLYQMAKKYMTIHQETK